MSAGDLERPLAGFALDTSWDDLDAHAQLLAQTLFLDALACAFSGAGAAARPSFATAARLIAGDTGAHVVVGSQPEAFGTAVLLNGWQTTATTMCDVYRERMCHVTPGVLPAVLAALDGREPSRTELLTAMLIGAEVTTRLCRAMSPEAYVGSRWHAPGVIGPFGAAAAYGRLVGLDVDTLARAWGAAGLQSAGTFAAIGSPGVKTTQARGAWSGVGAVVLATYGHGGRPDHLLHPHGGLFDAFEGIDPQSAVTALGTEWVVSELSLRRWPASSSLQSLVEAVLDLTDGHLPDQMTVALPPRSYALAATPGWDDELTALQSARWIAGAVWADRACWLDQFSAARRRDAALSEFVRHRVDVVLDEHLSDGGVRLSAAHGSSEVAREIEAPLGSPSRPMGLDAIGEKLASAAGQARAYEMLDLVTGATSWSTTRLVELLGRKDRDR